MGPSAAAVIMIVTATVVVGLLLVWALVTVWRIVFPERPLPLSRSQAEVRRLRTASGERVAVGFREIHEDMVEHSRRVRLGPILREPGAQTRPRQDGGESDLWERRN